MGGRRGQHGTGRAASGRMEPRGSRVPGGGGGHRSDLSPPPPPPSLPSVPDASGRAPPPARLGALRAAVRGRVSTETRKPRRRGVARGDRAIFLRSAPLHQPGHAAAVSAVRGRLRAHGRPFAHPHSRARLRAAGLPLAHLPAPLCASPRSPCTLVPPPPICTPTTCRLQQNRVLPFAHPQAPPRLCAAVCTAVSSHLHTHPLPQMPSRLHGPVCTATCPPLTLLRSPLPTHEPHLHTHTHRPHLHTHPAPMSTSCLLPPTLPLFAHPCSPLHVPTATGSAAAPCLQCWCSLWVPAAMRRGEHHLPPTPDPPGRVPTRNPCCPHRSNIDDDSAW